MAANIPLPGAGMPGLQAPRDAFDEYLRSAQLQAQLAQTRQQTEQQSQSFPVEQQQAQATLEQTQQQNQVRQQQMQEEKIFRDLSPKFVKRDEAGKLQGFDYDGLFAAAEGAGVSPITVAKHRQAHGQELDANAKRDEGERKKEAENNSWLFQTIESLKGIAEPNQRQAAYQRSVEEAGKRGFNVSQFPPQAPSNDQLTALEAPLGMHAEVLKNRKTEAEIADKQAGPAAEQELQAAYASWLDANKLPRSAANEWKFRQIYAGMHRAPKNDDASRDAIEAAAQSIASMNPKDLTRLKDVASMRGDQRLLIYNRAKQINPNFSTAEVDRKTKMIDSFTNGKDGQQLQSFGTFLEHAGEASRVVNDFRTTSVPLVNTPLNKIRDKFGDASYTRMTAALEPVRKEFEGFLLGGRALYADDREAAEKILSENSSPAQIQAALKQMGHTVKARYNEMNSRFSRQMGAGLDDVIGPMSDEALDGARQIGVELTGKKASSGTPSGNAPPKVGDTITFKGHQYRVTKVENGRVIGADPI